MPSFWPSWRASGFYRTVSVTGEAAREARIPLEARCHLVRQRCATENAIRGLLGSLGIRFAKGTGKLGVRVRAALEAGPELTATIEPLLSSVETLKTRDRRVGPGSRGAGPRRRRRGGC